MNTFIKFFSVIFVIFFLLFLVLINGISTSYFNSTIQKKISEKFPLSKLQFDTITASLELKNLDIKLKINNPNLSYNEKIINIKKIEVTTSLLSIIQKENKLKKVYLDLNRTQINDFLPIIETFKIDNLLDYLKKVKSGEVEGIFSINLDNFDDISAVGLIKNLGFEINNKLPLFSSINANFNFKKSKLDININKGTFDELKIKDSIFEIDIKDSLTKIFKTRILVDGQINNILKLNEKNNIYKIQLPKGLDNLNGRIEADILIDGALNKDFSLKNYNSNSQIKLLNGSAEYTILNKDPKKNHVFKLSDLAVKAALIDKKITIDGSVLFEKNIFSFGFNQNLDSDKFESNIQGKVDTKVLNNIIQNKFISGLVGLKVNFIKNKNLLIDVNLNLDQAEFKIDTINYKKNKEIASQLKFKIIPETNFYLITDFNYSANQDSIYFDDLNLNKDFYVNDLRILKINTKDNNFSITKQKKQFLISGEKINLTNYIKSLTSRDTKRSLYSKNFNSEFNVNFKQVIIADDFLKDVKMSAKLQGGKIINLNGFGAFSNTETAQVQIKKNNNNNLETILTSDKSKPFLIGLNFAKDFSNGKLSFVSEKFNDDKSYSKITLSKYYVKKMPILANLLSLTSFTGIIDTLEGKGVFFDKSYLEFEVINKQLEIKEAYGTGDSLGYTLEGRINPDGFVSLSGNLVPAYMLNNIIRQIPLIGKALTGKKGDGIFGASFKIKGQPDSLKTTVNPIRTLTPRFIQRFIDIFRSPN